MRRKPFAVALVLLSAALVLGGNALLDAGWGSVLRSIADRVLPNPEITMWAPAPEPGSHASSYADATGAGANYVYLVDAADDRQGQCPRAPAHLLRTGVGRRGLARDRGARRLGRALPRVRCGRGARGCARGSGPLSAALVQFRRKFQEVEHGEDTGSG